MRLNEQELDIRDKVLSALIYGLASLDRWEIIFKGGTMLRLAVFNDYRYSEDIDVTYIGNIEHETTSILQSVCDIAETVHKGRLAPVTTKDTRPWRHYVAYGERLDKLVKFESGTVKGENFAPPTETWTLIDRWGIYPEQVTIKGYSLESVLRDKFSCIGRRGEARDLYDIYRIAVSGKADLRNGWDLYLLNWQDSDSEWGKRSPPAELADSMLDLKGLIETSWVQSVNEGLFTGDLDFDSSFEYVHSLIEDLIASTPKKRLKG